MNYKISFQEMSKLCAEQLANQSVSTLKEKREQYIRIKLESWKTGQSKEIIEKEVVEIYNEFVRNGTYIE